MIIVPDRFVFLMNPHTGSRSMVEGFARAGLDVPLERVHHVKPEDIPQGLPRYAMLRNTIDWGYAFYWHWYPTPFDDFIAQFQQAKRWGPSGRLNLYEGYVDKYFCFEDGLDNILEELGFPQKKKLPAIGHNQRYKTPYFAALSQEDRLRREWALMEKFPEDTRQYVEQFGDPQWASC